ncbi:MAG: hypothetical protein ACRDY2_09890 [Acidimicrobiales bacterium]
MAARLVLDYPDDEEMRVSAETRYASLYLQGRGGLKRELISRCAPAGFAAAAGLEESAPGGRTCWVTSSRSRPGRPKQRTERSLVTGRET